MALIDIRLSDKTLCDSLSYYLYNTVILKYTSNKKSVGTEQLLHDINKALRLTTRIRNPKTL